MEKLSPLIYPVSIPGRKKNAILQTNLLKPFHTPIAQVHGIAVVEDDGLDFEGIPLCAYRCNWLNKCSYYEY